MFYVYILVSQNTGWRYIGSTQDIKRRLSEHNGLRSKATRPYAPFTLVYSEQFLTRADAMRREKYFKTGRGRSELKKIIRGRSSVD